MGRIKIELEWFKDSETLFVSKVNTNLIDTGALKIKEYNRIATPGEVGTAVKDFMMEIENGVEHDKD